MSEQKTISIKDALVASLESIEEHITFEGSIVETSGFRDLDELGGVARSGQLTLIAAPLEIEKIDFALNVVMNWLKYSEDNSALVCNPNIHNNLIIKKILSAEPRLKVNNLETGNLDEDEQDRLMNGSRFLHGIGERFLLTNESCIESIIAEIEKKASDLPHRFMVLITGVDGVQGDDVLGKLKRLAIKLDIAIVAVKSLSKECTERPDKRSKLKDLPDADRIPADKVLFVYCDDYYNPESPYAGQAQIIVAKNNFGPTGTVFLAHQPEYCSFFNILKEEDK